jgi:hypothetical protein
MIKHYMRLSVTVKNWLWAVILTVCLALFASGFWSVRADTRTATLTATAQVTAVPTVLVPTVIQHNNVSVTRDLPKGAQIQAQQTSAHTIRVTITY